MQLVALLLVAPGVYYRHSEDEKRIVATTSWIEFKEFLVVIGATAVVHIFPRSCKAFELD